MSRVQEDGKALKGSAGPGGRPEKKPIDKRWILIGGLIVFLVVVLVVLNLVAGGRGEAAISKGFVVGTWSCEDESAVIFYENGSVSWARKGATIEDEYVVDEEVIKFGAVNVRRSGERMAIDTIDGDQIVCERTRDE